MNDPVTKPDHYRSSKGIECLDAIEASMTDKEFRGYCKGNIQKYLWRYDKKNAPLEDLRKAAAYLERMIKSLTGQ